MRAKLLFLLSLLTLIVLGSIVGQAKPEPKTFGSGSAKVKAPPGVTDVAWVLDPANSALVSSVAVTLAEALAEGGQVCVQVTGSLSTILANGCASVAEGDASATVAFDSTPNTRASATAITGVAVTVIQVIANGHDGVKVTDVAWTPYTPDITRVSQVKVTFAPIDTRRDLRVNIRLTLKDADGDRLQRKEFKNVTLSRHSNTLLIWNLGPPVSAAAIARFEIQFDLRLRINRGQI